MKKLRKITCRICKAKFEPFNSLQVWCSPECGYELSKQREEAKVKRGAKEFRKQTREMKAKLKSKSQWLDEAQAACNAYIRERDKRLPCISCGTTSQNIQYCAGHYKTRGGHPELRFHPMNIHKQCNYHCNSQKSGNIDKYRPELIKKIGLLQVEWLEGNHEIQHLQIDDIKQIKIYYKEQYKILTEAK